MTCPICSAPHDTQECEWWKKAEEVIRLNLQEYDIPFASKLSESEFVLFRFAVTSEATRLFQQDKHKVRLTELMEENSKAVTLLVDKHKREMEHLERSVLNVKAELNKRFELNSRRSSNDKG